MILIFSILFSVCCFAQNSHVSKIKKDRAELAQEIAKELEKTYNFKKYDEIQKKQNEEIIKVYNKLNVGPQTIDTRKVVAQTIGYTTSVLGVVKSIWSIHVRNIGLTNKTEQLNLRYTTKEKLQNQIKKIEMLDQTEENILNLNSKIEALEDVSQKIGIDLEGIKNIKSGIKLDYFSVATSIGIFVLTLTIDPIVDWWNNHFTDRKQYVTDLLNNWDKIVIESGIINSNKENKFLIYLADNEHLKLNSDEFEEILYTYKTINPIGYEMLRQYCKHYLLNVFNKEINKYNLQYDMSLKYNIQDETYIRKQYDYK
jgi:hypothetical protein